MLKKGQQAQRLCNNQLKHQQKMLRGFCGHSPHFHRLLPGDGGYPSTYLVLSLFVEVHAAGAAQSHHISIIMAMEIIISKIALQMNIKDQRVRLPGLWPAFCLTLCNTYYTSRRIFHHCTSKVPRNHIFTYRTYSS